MIKYFCDYELQRAHPDDSGFELRCTRSTPRTMAPGERWLAPTSLRLALPRGVGAFICSRSGLSLHSGVIVLNAPGVIDAGYRGEVGVTLINLGQQPFELVPGERIAQLVLMPVLFPDSWNMSLNGEWGYANGLFRVTTVEELGTTERGSGGHGSTGRT